MKELKDLNLKSKDALNKLSADKLKEELHTAQKNLYVMKMKNVVGEQKQTHLIKPLRRYVASVMTLQGKV
ncbi:50S ribosomal protein L29 [Candidatus Gracilibacteria bacterium]|nr:50S ribosomal protein L29 [Candidatus Gracilibacteria bacterium]